MHGDKLCYLSDDIVELILAEIYSALSRMTRKNTTFVDHSTPCLFLNAKIRGRT
jgi:hypothetical protein